MPSILGRYGCLKSRSDSSLSSGRRTFFDHVVLRRKQKRVGHLIPEVKLRHWLFLFRRCDEALQLPSIKKWSIQAFDPIVATTFSYLVFRNGICQTHCRVNRPIPYACCNYWMQEAVGHRPFCCMLFAITFDHYNRNWLRWIHPTNYHHVVVLIVCIVIVVLWQAFQWGAGTTIGPNSANCTYASLCQQAHYVMRCKEIIDMNCGMHWITML